MVKLRIIDVLEINNALRENKEEYINKCEADFEKAVRETARYIKENGIKYVFVSGPSSSGKTTFSKRFAYYLEGITHYDISLDDYYKKLDIMPLKKNGEYNFESVYSLKTDKIKRDFEKLIKGEEVSLPLLDFKTGKRIENNEKIKMDENSVVVIEGLHALNSKILNIFKNEKIFTIFLCPDAEVKCDSVTLSQYDLRFIRRMVRDNNYRNSSAENSLRMWKTVREGEKIYMSGYRKKADVILNTFLDYEIAVLKKEAIPLLYGIPKENPHFKKCRKYINVLEKTEDIPHSDVPKYSLLNEFIKKC